jgi:tRNA A-37 threonylcarbamoyl transferase component Bud32
MHEIKDTLRASVRIGFDGRVHKVFRGPRAQERFDTETRVLKYLEERACPFVPRLLEAYPDQLKIVTSSCGSRVERMDDERLAEIFQELEQYGVRHDDAELRNVTYRQSDGRFCLIDFEFATILDELEPHDDTACEFGTPAAAPEMVRSDGSRSGSEE